MSIRRSLLLLALCCAALPATAPAGASPGTELGGCYRGNALTGERIPGTGSAGQSVRRQGDVWECRSPVLPAQITGGRFRVELPWLGNGTTTSGTFTWSDGSVSVVTGLPNTLWTVTSGPAQGHVLRFDLAMEMNGDWYYTDNAMAIDSLTVVR
ncbi:hypothetical protein LTV02_24195 [Nocardia yamanashiensis]|uniref:hypothetical protein n=1 Tax=Nocardia yamanashiensis TaxID=209247 RepID=UPI001E3CAD7A|nr:hypothetical protein [Nocardia yamanashiensis]UGT39186.1 hypothetical protein LTV02_24195 [Nocardia yamanashiensis]